MVASLLRESPYLWHLSLEEDFCEHCYLNAPPVGLRRDTRMLHLHRRDSRPAQSACLCKNRYVHDACLVKILNAVEHAKCPVCAAPYANVACTPVVVGIKCASSGGCACAAVLCAPVLLLCAAHTFLVVYNHRSTLSQQAQGVLYGLGVFMVAVAVGVLVRLAHEKLGCWVSGR